MNMNLKLLVVDDDADLADEVKHFLQQEGFDVAIALEAQSALNIIGADRTVNWIVISDIRMPGLDGFTLALILRDWAKVDLQVKIIFLTGNVSTDAAVRAVRAQAIDIISKSAISDRLLEAVGRAAAQFLESEIEDSTVQRSIEFPRNTNDTDIEGRVQRLIAQKELRTKYLPGQLQEEDTWGMFLEIFLAHLKGQNVPAANLYYSQTLTTSTALRRVASLIDAGLVEKFSDSKDGRRVLLGLTETGKETMRGFMAAWELLE